jgi:hypothetical protein
LTTTQLHRRSSSPLERTFAAHRRDFFPSGKLQQQRRKRAQGARALFGGLNLFLSLSLAVSNCFFCTFFFFQTPAFYLFANIPTNAFSNPMLDDASSSLAAKSAVTKSTNSSSSSSS